jgi:UDP-glucuronate 4-epimerase
MKILVTGGAGFIGSAVAKQLRSEGNDVVVVDNFNEYYDSSLKRARVEALLEGVTVLEGDITDGAFLRRVFNDYAFDAVAHLAAQAGVRYSVEHPEVYVESNIVGTQTLLQVMAEFGVTRLVYASTSSAYGNSTPVPFIEDAPADKPESIYAATKRSGELIAHVYHKLHGMDVTVLRFFTVYGPWGRPDMALFKFTEAMQKGDTIDVYNNGELRRDFTYIDDIVAGFVAALQKPMGYVVINLGNGHPVELVRFIEVLEAALQTQAQKNMLPMQEGDVFETYADTTKAKELLDFEAKTSIEEGVQKFVAWYMSYKENY